MVTNPVRISGASERDPYVTTRGRQDAYDRLLFAVMEKSSNGAVFDEEAALLDAIHELSYVDFHTDFRGDTGPELSHQMRAKLRYISALFPNIASLVVLANTIHGVIGNARVSPSDIRLILNGQSLANPAHRYQVIPYQRIQLIGQMLAGGASQRDTAKAVGVSRETVCAIDDFIGFTVRRQSNNVQNAIIAVREKTGVRAFARQTGLPLSSAHRYITEARAVLVELGELSGISS